MSRQDDIDLELELLQDESSFLAAKEEYLASEQHTPEQIEAYQAMKQAFEEKRTQWRSVASMAEPAEGEIRPDTIEMNARGIEPGGEG
jgi:hypothetical protein